MFESTLRPVVFPQSEHARLAGIIAQYWGNDRFARPELPFALFCAGVALHDFGYGYCDTDNIISMEPRDRHRTFESLLAMQFDDPIVEAVAKFHVARLMGNAGFHDLEARCRAQLDDLVVRSGVPEAAYRNADTITRLCDTIAFDFCLERYSSGSVEVVACGGTSATERVTIDYEISQCASESPSASSAFSVSGLIHLDPWPLTTPQVSGYLFAYEASSYPTALKPRRVAYDIQALPSS